MEWLTSMQCPRMVKFWPRFIKITQGKVLISNLQNAKNLPGFRLCIKVENILKGILDSIPSPSPSVKFKLWAGMFAG